MVCLMLASKTLMLGCVNIGLMRLHCWYGLMVLFFGWCYQPKCSPVLGCCWCYQSSEHVGLMFLTVNIDSGLYASVFDEPDMAMNMWCNY